MGASATAAQEDEAAAEAVAAAEEAADNKRKRKRNEKEAIEKIKNAKSKKSKKKKKHSDDEDDDAEFDPMDMYQKTKPLPGQFENCEICNKRFTVTPYSKEGPDGGLLCTPCGKQLVKDAKAEKAAANKKSGGRQQRRKAESNRLDGIAPNRAKSLLQLCIEKAAQYHDDIEELGDMPDILLERLSEIFSKKRVMNPKTMKLFVRPDLDNVSISDAAYLEVNDLISIFQIAPDINKIVLRNVCQMKDEVLEYMMDKCSKINYIQLYAANLVSHDMWQKVFMHYGPQLATLKLQWIDVTFDDTDTEVLVTQCPNLKRLKFKLLRHIGEGTINALAQLKHLSHLSLHVTSEVSPESLVKLITSACANLETLSLENFIDLDDSVVNAIHDTCNQLRKLRIAENDTATDAALTSLFTSWRNPPLLFADFNSTRAIDANNANGPDDEPIGLASESFTALMKHSGSALRHLDVASCRHISLQTFTDVFDGVSTYPALEYINVSFCGCVDTRVVAGIFKSCPALKRLVAFGCFDVLHVVVPRGIALIGVPKAQDEIEQIGVGMDVEEAVGKMVAVGAA